MSPLCWVTDTPSTDTLKQTTFWSVKNLDIDELSSQLQSSNIRADKQTDTHTLTNWDDWKYYLFIYRVSKNYLFCGSCTAKVKLSSPPEFEFRPSPKWWSAVATTANCHSSGVWPSFLLFVYVCKWVAGKKAAVAWTQAQVVNSNSTSTGKETPYFDRWAKRWGRRPRELCSGGRQWSVERHSLHQSIRNHL